MKEKFRTFDLIFPQWIRTRRGRSWCLLGVLAALSASTMAGACGGKEFETVFTPTGGTTSSGGTESASGGAVGVGGTPMVGAGGAPLAGSGGEGGLGGMGGVFEPTPLFGPPLVFNPTSEQFSINVILGTHDGEGVTAHVRASGERGSWNDLGAGTLQGNDVLEWQAQGLHAGTEYDYEIRAGEEVLFEGRATTQRGPGATYKFGLIADSHIAPQEVEPGSLDTYYPADPVLLQVGRNLSKEDFDFVVNLGDMLDFHLFGFNVAPPDGSWTRLAYLNYRRLLHYSLGLSAHFPVVGNWEGENGNFTTEEIAFSRAARLRYAPGPEPDTYPEGGSPFEDYYAFTWGDALFVVLNVMTYTPTAHLLGSGAGMADDWTLGQEQLTWLETTLAAATSKWKFLLIHHVVGGAAGDEINAAYGRGGGQAAMVGEQAVVHQMMLDAGVQIFFYGHDHVFTDMVVDGIHYTLPGSAGAPWKFEGDETGYTQYWTDSGHGSVTVSPDSVKVEFLGMERELLYSYEITE